MNTNTKAYQIWLIFFPILIYFAIIEFVAVFVNFLAGVFDAYVSGTMRQLLGMTFALLVLYVRFYRSERKDYGIWHDDEMSGRFGGAPAFGACALVFVTMLAAGYAANNFATVINLSRLSQSYGETESYLYSGSIVAEIIAFAIVAPLAEELLYRGVVFMRVRRMLGRWSAIVLSTVLFSIFHFNLVQMAYALYMGFLLALFMEFFQNLWIPIIGHAAANLLSVLRTEFSWLTISQMGYDLYLGSALVLFALTIAVAIILIYRMQRKLNLIVKTEGETDRL